MNNGMNMTVKFMLIVMIPTSTKMRGVIKKPYAGCKILKSAK